MRVWTRFVLPSLPPATATVIYRKWPKVEDTSASQRNISRD